LVEAGELEFVVREVLPDFGFGSDSGLNSGFGFDFEGFGWEHWKRVGSDWMMVSMVRLKVLMRVDEPLLRL
jgi:hypothetical protein